VLTLALGSVRPQPSTAFRCWAFIWAFRGREFQPPQTGLRAHGHGTQAGGSASRPGRNYLADHSPARGSGTEPIFFFPLKRLRPPPPPPHSIKSPLLVVIVVPTETAVPYPRRREHDGRRGPGLFLLRRLGHPAVAARRRGARQFRRRHLFSGQGPSVILSIPGDRFVSPLPPNPKSLTPFAAPIAAVA